MMWWHEGVITNFVVNLNIYFPSFRRGSWSFFYIGLEFSVGLMGDLEHAAYI